MMWEHMIVAVASAVGGLLAKALWDFAKRRLTPALMSPKTSMATARLNILYALDVAKRDGGTAPELMAELEVVYSAYVQSGGNGHITQKMEEIRRIGVKGEST